MAKLFVKTFILVSRELAEVLAAESILIAQSLQKAFIARLLRGLLAQDFVSFLFQRLVPFLARLTRNAKK